MTFAHSLTPSPTCGPYREYNETIDVIRDKFDDWSENNQDAEQALTIIIETLTSTFFVVALFVVLWLEGGMVSDVDYIV